MVEEVTVNPGSVRCLGNIVSPKLLSDYNKYFSKITSDTDTVDGDTRTVYTSEYITGSKLTVTAPRIISVGTETFTVTATLKRTPSNLVISDASVTCIVNNNTTYTATTDSSGVCSFTVNVEEDVDDYRIQVIYDGTNSISGCFLNQRTHVADIDELTLTVNKSVTQTGDDVYLIGTLTGTSINGETVPVPFATVNFYEVYTPGIELTLSPEVVVSGDTSTITAQLRDTTDGSLVRKSGETISIYIEED